MDTCCRYLARIAVFHAPRLRNLLMRITSFFFTPLFMLFTSAVFADAQQLMGQIRTDHAALLAAEVDFHTRRERGVLNGTEASDYASYIARLHRLLAESCMALTQLQNESEFPTRNQTGEQHLIDRLCPELSSITQPVAIDQGAEQTRAEHIAALDAELNAGLGEFDELLLREQERVKAATPPQNHRNGAAGGGNENAAGTKSNNADTGDETNGDSNSQIKSTNNGHSSGARGGTDSSKQTASGQPSGVPDGSDDDVVARQLREAAEKETDPELKRKLWEEYKKYKQGTK